MSAPERVEFFFDFGSPTAYLAYTQLPAIAAEAGAELVWRPMLLGGVFKATGNASPVTVPAKGRWMNEDIARWAQRHGVPFRFNPHFPINTLTLMRGAVGLQLRAPDRFRAYVDAVYRAMWQAPRNLGDPQVLAATLAEAGFDAEAFGALVAEPEVKAALVANTDEAVARGVFGAPTVFVGAQMFFGQDRLDFVREALLAGAAPAAGPRVALRAADAPVRQRPSVYPEPFAAMMAGRVKHPLGDLFGLKNFGVNLTRLAPGAVSALRHAHRTQDEFVYVLQGRPTLHTDAGRTPLAPGLCAGFAAGSGDAHRLINETDAEAVYLEIGDRSEGDEVQYPDDDLKALREGGAWRFLHKDGTPYD
jgi:2-hydroxychromene-2-carboxylate isomerase/uncharacterized cupin superfamily protein